MDEFWPLVPDERVDVRFRSGEAGTARDWSEWLELDGGEVVAEYASGPLAGRRAAVRNRVDDGSVLYVSARLDEQALARIVGDSADEASVTQTLRERHARGCPGLAGTARTSSC